MTAAITVSERAARRIGQILKSEGEGAKLRISVEGGGCSGFQYKFDVEHEYLGFVLQAAEGGGMNDPVAIAPERAAGLARRLQEQPPPAVVGVAGIKRAGGSHSDRHGNLILIHLIPLTGTLNYVGGAIPNELGMTPWSMIGKSGYRFSERIMLKQRGRD